MSSEPRDTTLIQNPSLELGKTEAFRCISQTQLINQPEFTMTSSRDTADFRVCMFGSEIAPSTDDVYIGGSVTSAVNLSKSLSDKGVKIHVLTTPPRDWNEFREEIKEEWGEINVFRATPQHPGIIDGITLFYRGVKRLVEFCENHDVDVIHSHSGYSVLAAISAIAATIVEIPVVHSLYCPVPNENYDGIEERLSSPFFARNALSRCDHVFSMTENVQSSLEKCKVRNSSTLPPIVNYDTFRPGLEPPTSVDITGWDFTVLFVGSLKPEKGLEYLIKAVGELSDEVSINLIITTERDFPGSEHREHIIDELIKEYNIEDQITRIGIISDMANLMANVDVLVAPFTSTSGPSDYPIAILEAMACQTKVIGSDIGGIPELLKDGRGSLVEAANSDALADELMKAKKQKEDDETDSAVREFIINHFSGDAVAGEVLSKYSKL